MSARFLCRVTELSRESVHLWDPECGHSLFLERSAVEGGEQLCLNDWVVVEGDEHHRHARRLSADNDDVPAKAANS